MAAGRLRSGRGYKRRRRTTPYRRRVRKKVRRTRRGRLSLARLLPFPERFKTCLTYTADYELNAAQGTTSWQLFRANSMYDCDFSGAGHQPLYYDNLSAIYQKYVVRCCYITVTVLECNVNASTPTDTTRGRLFVVRDQESADITGLVPGLMQEEKCPNIKWRYFGTEHTGRFPKLMFRCKPYVQCRLPYNDSSLEALIGADPTATCFLGVGLAGVATQIDPPNMIVNVRLNYKCEFFDRKIVQPEN